MYAAFMGREFSKERKNLIKGFSGEFERNESGLSIL